ncbi:MAG TPA: dihydroorotate dehydrogenase electron transfer subunit [Candidatus Eisenbacteria bacterium]|jgi:dihydroorotate dehydrogenase electron transfer subunit|nr:dihydroorotate dehydrogenase electron transfer subunit [Candidatus Eisenbacteria bacterium]
MRRERCRVLENTEVAPAHYVMRLASPSIAREARPGAFVQVLASDACDPLLPRPFSFLTATRRDFSILYHVVGRGTRILSLAKKGDTLSVAGPFGRPFTHEARRNSDRIVNVAALVGGGVGIPPLFHLAQFLQKPVSGVPKSNVHVFLGARHKSLLLCEKEFRSIGVTPVMTTDDGSRGRRGLVTGPLEDFLRKANPMRTRVYTCGPTPMLAAVSALSEKYGVACEASVEVPMACGFGACLGCAIKVKGNPSSDVPYRFAIACCEGPVFPGSEVLW